MADDTLLPVIEAAVALIERDGRFLTVYNPKWMSFTLPMTKRRVWDDKRIPVAHREEAWEFAGARAAAEVLGRTITDLKLEFEIREYRQGDREGGWREYHLQVFRIVAQKGDAPVAGLHCEWLTADEFLDKNRNPISPTAREVMRQLGGVHDPNPMLQEKA